MSLIGVSNGTAFLHEISFLEDFLFYTQKNVNLTQHTCQANLLKKLMSVITEKQCVYFYRFWSYPQNIEKTTPLYDIQYHTLKKTKVEWMHNSMVV